MRRKILRAVGTLLLVAVGGFLFLMWLYPEPRIGRANFARLKAGMSEEQVQELLGPRDLSQPGRGLRKPFEDTEVLFGQGKGDVEVTKEWRGKGRVISVWFCVEGKVVGANYIRFEENVLEMLLRWVGF